MPLALPLLPLAWQTWLVLLSRRVLRASALLALQAPQLAAAAAAAAAAPLAPPLAVAVAASRSRKRLPEPPRLLMWLVRLAPLALGAVALRAWQARPRAVAAGASRGRRRLLALSMLLVRLGPPSPPALRAAALRAAALWAAALLALLASPPAPLRAPQLAATTAASRCRRRIQQPQQRLRLLLALRPAPGAGAAGAAGVGTPGGTGAVAGTCVSSRGSCGLGSHRGLWLWLAPFRGQLRRSGSPRAPASVGGGHGAWRAGRSGPSGGLPRCWPGAAGTAGATGVGT